MRKTYLTQVTPNLKITNRTAGHNVPNLAGMLTPAENLVEFAGSMEEFLNTILPGELGLSDLPKADCFIKKRIRNHHSRILNFVKMRTQE